MPNFDYAQEAELFDPSPWAELSVELRNSRPPVGYKRFARAADAIRFAIEDLSPPLLLETCLEVDDVTYRSEDILRLYESAGYPHSRRTAGPRL